MRTALFRSVLLPSALVMEAAPGGPSAREGLIDVPGGRVWYRVTGKGDGVPLVLLHGGPGAPSYYLEPMAALGDERPVVFYDQLGCGRSDRPDDSELWRIDRFIEELGRLRRALGLDSVHLFGQSWGGLLAVEYLLTRPTGVVSVTLSGPVLSVPRWEEDQRRYVAALPERSRRAIEYHERAGTTGSEEYQAVMMEYYRRHVCRLEPWPPEMEATIAGMGEPVYRKMWGPSEFNCTGTLKGHDVTGRLGEILVPVLLTCGRYDEARPQTMAWYQTLIPGSWLVIFEGASHETMLEQWEAYVAVVRGFLREVEQSRE